MGEEDRTQNPMEGNRFLEENLAYGIGTNRDTSSWFKHIVPTTQRTVVQGRKRQLGYVLCVQLSQGNLGPSLGVPSVGAHVAELH